MNCRRLMGLVVALIALSATAGYAGGPPEGGYLSDGSQSLLFATYATGKTLQIEGSVVAVHFRDVQHSFIQMMAFDERGQTRQWAIEWGAVRELRHQGVTQWTLRPGDHVIVAGFASRQPENHRIRAVAIERPFDGWKWGGVFD